MRVAPTLDRSLRIDAENPTDWLVLEMICTDASQMPDEPLAEQLSLYMCADDDWADLMTPELSEQFNEQVLHVSRAISTAEKNPDLTGSLFIKADEADIWFGAINQARLSLEERFEVSQYDDSDDQDALEFENPNLKAALIRYHFYTSLQSIMLEYILD
ncbi:DUF2017 family protein [Rubritalea tangerina]|uniref:DUF2017 family protein n=1 Tax=Rubritalea tangerina TaxID=430798 RepID=A0ABW4ZEJ4_9BACT